MRAFETAILKVNHLEDIQEKIHSLNTNVILCVDGGVYRNYKKFWHDQKNLYPIYQMPRGEKAKTFKSLKECLEFCLSCNISRKTHLVAVGGGATSDVASLAASILLRGISWSCIPTTLLSMVDAAFGGKTAINVGGYKNQVGTFHCPQNVLIYYGFLNSLPREEWESGMGEVVKYGLLSSTIYEKIMSGNSVEELILDCAHYKKTITCEDLRDVGRRKILNLGHTLGHAFESLFSLSHGKAVLWGMWTLFRMLGRNRALEQMECLLERLGLDKGERPWGSRPFPVNSVFECVKRDKKKQGDSRLEIIDCLRAGDIEIREMGLSDFRTMLSLPCFDDVASLAAR